MFVRCLNPSCSRLKSRLSACLSEVGATLVQVLLILFYTSCVFLFIGTCVLGLCISCMFPSMLAFTEDVLDYKGADTHTHTCPHAHTHFQHV